MLPIKIVAQEVQFVAWVEKRRYSSSPCSILLSHSIHSSRHIKETNRYQFSNPSFLTVIGSAFPIDRPKNPFDSRKQIIWWKKMFCYIVQANFCLITQLLTVWYSTLFCLQAMKSERKCRPSFLLWATTTFKNWWTCIITPLQKWQGGRFA